MKKINQRGILLGITLLGATTLIGLNSPASAKPNKNHDGIPNNARPSRQNDGIPNNARPSRQNDGIPNNARRANPFNDGIPNNAPVTRRNDGIPNNARRANPFRDGIPNNAPVTPRNDGIPNNARRNNPFNDGIPNNASRYGSNNNGRYGNDQRSVRGIVVGLRSQQNFDLRVGDKTYQVNATSRIPRALSRGDYVEVNGYLSGGNDLNNASVSLVRNR